MLRVLEYKPKSGAAFVDFRKADVDEKGIVTERNIDVKERRLYRIIELVMIMLQRAKRKVVLFSIIVEGAMQL